MKKGIKPFIIPIFIPHAGCPHQCAFCNQKAITGTKENIFSADYIFQQIKNFLNYKGQRNPSQISFFGGTFLGLPAEKIIFLLDIAQEFVRSGQIDNIRFSTRPDSIDSRRLDMISGYSVSDIEIGAQSMENHVLNLSNRGHSVQDTESAVTLLKKRGYRVGLQMMIGLPGETADSPLITATRIANLAPDYVRIYPTVVLKGSPLALWLQKGHFQPLHLDEAVTLTKRIYLFFKSRQIPVIRMGLQASSELDSKKSILAGPYHPAFGHMVFSEIFLDTVSMAIDTLSDVEGQTVEINVHPKNISKMRGLTNKNIFLLTRRFNIQKLKVTAESSLSPESILINRRHTYNIFFDINESAQ